MVQRTAEEIFTKDFLRFQLCVPAILRQRSIVGSGRTHNFLNDIWLDNQGTHDAVF